MMSHFIPVDGEVGELNHPAKFSDLCAFYIFSPRGSIKGTLSWKYHF